ncbi:MAG: type II secretion system protein N [Gammaproteobacteria bacterium]
MRKPLLLATFGFILILVFMLVLWPARVAVGWFLPANVALSGVTGTVWQGSASQLSIDGHVIGGLTWDARSLSVLSGSPRWQIELRRPAGFVRADVAVSTTGSVQVSDLTAASPLQGVADLVPLAGTDGNLTVNLPTLALEQGQLTALSGQIVVDALSPMGLADVNLGTLELMLPADQTPPFSGSLSALDGPLLVEDGRLELAANGSYTISGRVKARDDAPDNIRQGIQFLGTPDPLGFYPFLQRGSL